MRIMVTIQTNNRCIFFILLYLTNIESTIINDEINDITTDLNTETENKSKNNNDSDNNELEGSSNVNDVNNSTLANDANITVNDSKLTNKDDRRVYESIFGKTGRIDKFGSKWKNVLALCDMFVSYGEPEHIIVIIMTHWTQTQIQTQMKMRKYLNKSKV